MEYKKLQELDKKHHLHPFTNHREMHEVGTHVIHGSEGIYIHDQNGKMLLDGLAGLWCVNVGYGRREIIDAVKRQMESLAFYPSFFNSTTESAILLAERLIRIGPKNLTHAFFSNSGTEANETALKLIRGYHKIRGNPKKIKILNLSYSYHGVSIAATSMTRLPSCQNPFDLPLPNFIEVPGPYRYSSHSTLSPKEYGQWCLSETERIIKQEGAETIGALFAEPVQGAGGVIVPPVGYLSGLRDLCRKYSILFVVDEVICAFGRLGDWFASNLWNLEPDFLTTAKGITSGYLPLGATLVSGEVAQTLIAGGYLAHGSTYSGHPTACTAALANLDIIEKENLLEKVSKITGPYLQKRLRELEGHPAVGEVRGFGLIGAVEVLPRGGKAALNPNAPLGPKAVKLCRDQGVIVRGIRDLAAIAPPLIISEKQIDDIISALKHMLDHLWD